MLRFLRVTGEILFVFAMLISLIWAWGTGYGLFACPSDGHGSHWDHANEYGFWNIFYVAILIHPVILALTMGALAVFLGLSIRPFSSWHRAGQTICVGFIVWLAVLFNGYVDASVNDVHQRCSFNIGF